VPLLGVVENMSYFVCPHCGGRTDVFSHGGARQEAEKLGVPFLGEVPLDIAIRVNSDDGRPVVATMAESPQANALLDVARRVADTLAAGAPGAKPPPRIRILQ
jgi:ATP-binding protein involved in chromosome partitioning